MEEQSEHQGMAVRNSELRHTDFYDKVLETGFLYDLQGIVINSSFAVEAIDLKDDDFESYKTKAFGRGEKEWFVKAFIAEKLSCDLFVLLHKKTDDKDIIRKIRLTTEIVKEGENERYTVSEQDVEDFSVDEFVNWWKEKTNGWSQIKNYRPDMDNYLKKSYFDKLLSDNKLSWPLNIDGFYIRKVRSEPGSKSFFEPEIRALIENRFTTITPFLKYDPIYYVNEDTVAWKGLKIIAAELKLPLILCTYSRRSGEEYIAGIAEIQNDTEDKFIYQNDVKPYENTATDANDVIQKIRIIINEQR